jgi:hypothetical protein
MPLLGQAAMLLTFDIVADAVSEHDDWHTHEHMPERLAIPGFLRGTRWVAVSGAPRYLVLYEVEGLETLASAKYLERLDNPTPWTRKMMPHYRGMSRGLCSVAHSCGIGMGGYGLLIRFKPAGNHDASLDEWLGREVMPRLPERPGLASVHLLRGVLKAEMTAEQRIRGADAGVDWAILATGYLQDVVSDLARSELGEAELEKHGAADVSSATYQAGHGLSAQEIGR